MGLSVLSYGQTVFYTGIVLVGLSVTLLLLGTVYFYLKRKKIKKQLMDKYGF